MNTIQEPNNISTQKVQTRISLDGQMKAWRLQEGDGIPKVSVTLGQTNQEQLPLKSSFINFQGLMILASFRKTGKSFVSLVTAGWQLKERMGGVYSFPQLRPLVGPKFKVLEFNLLCIRQHRPNKNLHRF